MTAVPERRSQRQAQTETETETMKIARLETATETMMAYIGYLNTQIFNEEKLTDPDLAKIQALEEQIQVVLAERNAIRPDNEKLIARAIYVYAPIMKALYANGRQIQA